MNSREAQTRFDLSADRPGSDPSSDRLGYAPFAKRLAKSIATLSRAEGHVVALYGSWGFGKTTMLNYVRHYLNAMEPNERPVIVSYNPWWFSGHEDLVRAFFGQLRAKVEEQKEFPSDVRTRLADFAEALSEVPLPYFSWGKLAGRMIRPKPKDIEKLKSEISTALRAQPGRPVCARPNRLIGDWLTKGQNAQRNVGVGCLRAPPELNVSAYCLNGDCPP